MIDEEMRNKAISEIENLSAKLNQLFHETIEKFFAHKKLTHIENVLFADECLIQCMTGWAAFSSTSLYGSVGAQAKSFQTEEMCEKFIASTIAVFEENVRLAMQKNQERWSQDEQPSH